MNENVSESALAHPVEAFANEIEQRGVLVADNVNRLPIYGEPYISDSLVITICHRGVSHGEYDMQPVTFTSHDFSVIYPNHAILALDSSDDYCVTLIVMSAGFYEQLRHRFTYGNSHVFHSRPKFHLTDRQYECVCDVVRLLKTVSRMDFTRSKEAIAIIVDVFSLMADEFLRQNEGNTADSEEALSRIYFNRFYECLVGHYRESREVGYYVRELGLSPKYFGSLIKKETGVSAGEWIARYIVIQAKTLLRYRADLSVQQVSDLLGFAEQASFSRFFKQQTGLSPKEYRLC